MKKRIIALLTAALLLGCAFAEEEPAQEAPAVIGVYTEAEEKDEVTYDMTGFTCEEGGYRIDVPADWTNVDTEKGEGAVRSFKAFVSPDGTKSLSILTAPSMMAGAEDITTDVDSITSQSIGRLRNVTVSDKNGVVTSGEKVYMYIGYLVDETKTVDQYFCSLGDDIVLVTFVNESDNAFKGAVLSTLNALAE